MSAIGWAGTADRQRNRHRLLVALGAAGTLCFFPILWVEGAGALAAVLIAIAVLHGPLLPMLDAVVLDHLDDLGGDYGRLRLWGSAAFVAGALGAAPLVTAGSPRVLPVLLVLSVLGVTPALARLPRAQRGHAQGGRGMWTLLSPPMAAFLATAFLINLSSGAWQGLFAVHTRTLGLPDATPGLAYGLAVIAEIVLFFQGRALLARIDAPGLILFVVGVTTLRWAATAFATGLPAVLALQLLHVVTFSVFHLAAMRLLSVMVPPERSTSGQALYGLVAFGIGGGAGVALAGRLLDHVDTAHVFGIDAFIAAAAVLPALMLLRLAPRG